MLNRFKEYLNGWRAWYSTSYKDRVAYYYPEAEVKTCTWTVITGNGPNVTYYILIGGFRMPQGNTQEEAWKNAWKELRFDAFI